jgi:hypothetical protein
MDDLTCILCGTPETERPLLAARFDKKDVHVCPGCIPTLIHGVAAPEMAQMLRERSDA